MLTSSYLFTLLLTLVIEIIVAMVLGYRSRSVILAIVLVNLITNPILNFVLWNNSISDSIVTPMVSLVGLEITVVIIESLLLSFALRRKLKPMLVLSLAMNLVSFSIGLLFIR